MAGVNFGVGARLVALLRLELWLVRERFACYRYVAEVGVGACLLPS